MNRLQIAGQDLQAETNSLPSSIEQELLCRSPQNDSDRAVFVPLHYEANYAYPLLIWLHGPGDDERQLKQVMPLISLRNYVAMAPRGTHQQLRGHDVSGVYTWQQTQEEIFRAQQRILACIESAQQRFHISPKRIFLGGYDAGGTMALRVGVNQPQRFAGVFSIGGSFPTGHTPLLHIQRAREMPLLIAHGRDSTTYTESHVCKDLRLIHVAGMSVTLRQYPCGAELTTQMLRDVDEWIMQQVTGAQATDSELPCYRQDELN